MDLSEFHIREWLEVLWAWMPPQSIVVFAGMLALVLVTRAHRSRKNSRQRDTTEAWAQQHGWSYADGGRDVAASFTGEPFAGRGELSELAGELSELADEAREWYSYATGLNVRSKDRKPQDAQHVLRGPYQGRTFTAFEYLRPRRNTGSNSGRSREPEPFQIVTVDAPPGLPKVEVERKGPLGMAASAVGAGGIRTGDDTFDKAFTVQAVSDDMARMVLPETVRQYLLEDPSAMQAGIRFERGGLMTWRSGALNTDSVESRVAYLTAVLDRLEASREAA